MKEQCITKETHTNTHAHTLCLSVCHSVGLLRCISLFLPSSPSSSLLYMGFWLHDMIDKWQDIEFAFWHKTILAVCRRRRRRCRRPQGRQCTTKKPQIEVSNCEWRQYWLQHDSFLFNQTNAFPQLLLNYLHPHMHNIYNTTHINS